MTSSSHSWHNRSPVKSSVRKGKDQQLGDKQHHRKSFSKRPPLGSLFWFSGCDESKASKMGGLIISIGSQN